MRVEKVLFKLLYIPRVVSVKEIFDKIKATGKERNLSYVSVVLCPLSKAGKRAKGRAQDPFSLAFESGLEKTGKLFVKPSQVGQ
jgi:hypothetical protein